MPRSAQLCTSRLAPLEAVSELVELHGRQHSDAPGLRNQRQNRPPPTWGGGRFWECCG
jgi:hypothetical protein